MSTKTNANAHAIISNMNKFKIGDGYTYKDICMICKIKEYKSGSNSRNKQMGTFNELFNIEESKRGKAVIYTIISKKKLQIINQMFQYQRVEEDQKDLEIITMEYLKIIWLILLYTSVLNQQNNEEYLKMKMQMISV